MRSLLFVHVVIQKANNPSYPKTGKKFKKKKNEGIRANRLVRLVPNTGILFTISSTKEY